MKILLGVVVLVIVVVLFDWNWFRPALERYLSEKSHRVVTADDLHVSLGFEPTVRIRGLYIENAAWADKRPMARVGEASFTFAPRSLWEKKVVVSRLVLIDADVDLERQADGLRNWRLRRPDDRGPGRYKILALEAQRSKLRFAHRGMALDFTATANPLPSPVTRPLDGEVLTTLINFKGVYRGAEFAGAAMTGHSLTFLETDEFFPLRGHATTGKTRLDVDGMVADAFKLEAVNATVRIAGPSLSSLHPFLPFRLPVSRPFAIETRLQKTESEYTFATLRGTLGASDLAGDASYSNKKKRPSWRAALHSESLNLSDLTSMVGTRNASGTPSFSTPTASAKARAAAVSAAAPRTAAEPNDPDHLFSRRAFRAESFNTVDVHLTLAAKKLKASVMPALESLRLTAELNDGVLALNPVDLGLAGGHVMGAINVDAQQRPLATAATLDFRNIRLEQLFPALPPATLSPGPLTAQLQLTGKGNSIAAILGNASGTVAATMDGGRISNRLDAKLGQDIGKIIRLFIRGDRDLPVHCGAIAFNFNNGIGVSQTILLDTEQTRTDGSGTVNLRDETLDLLLIPQPKKPGMFTLHASIRAHGSFKHIHVALNKSTAPSRSPAENAVPPFKTGISSDNPCAAILAASARQRPQGKQ